MCFGPGASFAASVVLAAVGTATVKESRSKTERLFAFFPVLFAAHQFIEGVLWLLIEKSAYKTLTQGLTFVYLLIAYCFWPVLFPLGLSLLEPQPARKKLFAWLIAFGAVTSLYLLYFIVTGPSQASIVNCSLQYDTNVPPIRWLGFFYVAAVLAPFFVSSYRPMHLIGLINLIFYAQAYYYYSAVFASVWCFFAAVLSLNIYFFFRWLHGLQPSAASRPE
jgi:hypothetical protein